MASEKQLNRYIRSYRRELRFYYIATVLLLGVSIIVSSYIDDNDMWFFIPVAFFVGICASVIIATRQKIASRLEELNTNREARLVGEQFYQSHQRSDFDGWGDEDEVRHDDGLDLPAPYVETQVDKFNRELDEFYQINEYDWREDWPGK